jgi:hypothetical protein
MDYGDENAVSYRDVANAVHIDLDRVEYRVQRLADTDACQKPRVVNVIN